MEFKIYYEGVEIVLPLVQEKKKINEMLNDLQPKFSQLTDNVRLMKVFNLGIKYAKADFYQIVGARQIISSNYLSESMKLLSRNKLLAYIVTLK